MLHFARRDMRPGEPSRPARSPHAGIGEVGGIRTRRARAEDDGRVQDNLGCSARDSRVVPVDELSLEDSVIGVVDDHLARAGVGGAQQRHATGVLERLATHAVMVGQLDLPVASFAVLDADRDGICDSARGIKLDR